MREELLVRIFSAVFLSMCTGSIFFVYWTYLSNRFVNQNNQKMYDYFIKIIVCLYFIPIVYCILVRNYEDGFLFFLTPTIQKAIFYITIVWAIGTLCMLFRFLKSALQCTWEKNSCIPCKEWMVKTLEDCKTDIGVKRNISIYQGYRIRTPMIMGLFRPCILLPMNEFSKEELKVYLYHELNHYKKHDILWNYLSCLMVCIHWYFPPVRWVYKSVDQWSEICCDMISIPYVGSLKKYFSIIIRMCENKNYMNAHTVACLFENKSLLEERINYAISHFNRRKSKRYVVVLITMSFVAMSSVSVYAMTRGYHQAYLTLVDKTTVEIEEKGGDIQRKKMNEKEELLRINKKEKVIAAQLAGDDAFGVDHTIKKNEYFVLDYVKAKNNDKLDVCIGGFEKSDIVRVGIIDEEKMVRYVQITNEEEIWHTFVIKEAGIYKVFIENLSGKEMKVCGYIGLLPRKKS